MRKVHIQYLNPDMTLARTIYDSDGRTLLQAGVSLKEEYIELLQGYNVQWIYIHDDRFGEIEDIPEIISEETRIQTIREVKANYRHLEQNRKMNTRSLKFSIERLLDEIMSNISVLVGLQEITVLDDHIFQHSVSVCILSMMTGITMGYDDRKLVELGIGALLHDVGKSRLSEDILRFESQLNDEDYQEWKKHPEYGFGIIKAYDDFSLLSAHVAYQHHERWDGKGFPRGLAAQKIHEYARIVAVANMYDEILSDRPNRPPYEVHQAINLIKRMSGSYFEPRIVAAMMSHIASYPVGTIVRLNTGELGMITAVHPDRPTRPVVRIAYDRNNRRIANPWEVDLSRLTTVFIADTITERELSKLISV